MIKWIHLLLSVFVIIAKTQAFPAELDGNHILTEVRSGEEERIHFYLYTEANSDDPVEIDVDDLETLARSTFDSKIPTTIVFHGWKDRYAGGAAMGIKNALLREGQNRKVNFISVDWNVYSKFENYTISKELCSTAGKEVAHFMDWMHDNARMAFDTLTLYGSSMGAHVAGFAGKNVKRGKVHRIIALDPALPMFDYNSPKDRLADTDADYVESIQTNGGYWGFYQPIGHITFYPNGGKQQPGCDGEMCSHVRAVVYVVEVLNAPEQNDFHAVKCDHLDHVAENKCDGYESIIKLGDPSNIRKPKGIYYLETNSVSPFAKGTDYIFKKMQETNKPTQS